MAVGRQGDAVVRVVTVSVIGPKSRHPVELEIERRVGAGIRRRSSFVAETARRLLVARRINVLGQLCLLGFANCVAEFAKDTTSRAAKDVIWNTT